MWGRVQYKYRTCDLEKFLESKEWIHIEWLGEGSKGTMDISKALWDHLPESKKKKAFKDVTFIRFEVYDRS